MPKAFRLGVIEELRDWLAAEVDGTGDYTFDLTAKVHFGLEAYGANDVLPIANWIEDPREQAITQTTVVGKGHTVAWKLVLQGFVENDQANPTAPAYTLAADMMKGFSALIVTRSADPVSYLWRSRVTNRVEEIRIGAPIVRPPDEFSDKAYCLIPVTLEMFETPSQPFT